MFDNPIRNPIPKINSYGNLDKYNTNLVIVFFQNYFDFIKL